MDDNDPFYAGFNFAIFLENEVLTRERTTYHRGNPIHTEANAHLLMENSLTLL